MEPLDLHYSRAKLVRLALLSLLVVGLMLWAATEGIDQSDSGGRRTGIARALGPDGLQFLLWVVIAASAGMAGLYLRQAFADPIAARANADGVTLNTLFGSRFYAAADIDRLELRHPAGQPMLQIVPLPGRGRSSGLAVNGLAEDENDVEAWIYAAQAAQRG